MKRAERIAKLTDEYRWDETKSVIGIPKTKVPKTVVGRKKVKKTKDDDDDKKGKKKK